MAIYRARFVTTSLGVTAGHAYFATAAAELRNAEEGTAGTRAWLLVNYASSYRDF